MNEQAISKALNLFLIIFLTIGAALGGVAAVFYHAEINTYLNDLKTRELHIIELQHTAISDEFDSIISDLLFLSRQNELYDFLNTGSDDAIKGIENEYLELGASKRMYGQIRLLDKTGMEKVRIDYHGGKAQAASPDILQNKGQRYYFLDCFSLQDREIFVSPLDLNVEHGVVEKPFKPMIRFGTPVFDDHGEKRGIVLLNYLATPLLDRIVNAGGSPHEQKMLLNSQGYWLLSPNKTDEWGFMFKDRRQDSFAKRYPTEWRRFLDEGKGQIQTDNGLFTFHKVYPFQEGLRSSSGSDAPHAPSQRGLTSEDYFWVLVSKISPEAMKEYTYSLMIKLFLWGAGLFVVIAFGAWHLAMAITKRKIYQAQLRILAMYDSLTGLPNRKLFFDQLDVSLETAERYDRMLGLLYIDLDGFKQVNDTLGHDAGDELLIQVGERLKDCVRKSDMVARLGGDEFAIALLEIKGNDEAKAIGNKIVEAMCQPFNLKSGTVNIGASIGAAVYPFHETSAKDLVKCADKVMYMAKNQGKNNCILAD